MKRIILFLVSLLLTLSLYACQIPEVNAPTTSTIETTSSTDPTWHLQEVSDKLAGYAIDFNWNDSIIEVILTVGLPNLDKFDRVEKEDDTTFDIYLTDGTSYEVVLDAITGEVFSVHNNVAIPTENDSYYKG